MDLSVQQFRSKAEQALLDIYEAAADGLPGSASIAAMRQSAIRTFGSLGLPHRRIEAWKYTDLRGAIDDVPPLAASTGVSVDAAALEAALGTPIIGVRAYRLVLAEGEFRADLSDVSGLREAGVEFGSLAQALEAPPSWLTESLNETASREGDVLLALNTALMSCGVVLRLPEGLTLQKPIHIVHLDGASMASSTFARNVIIAEEGASATVIESFGTLGANASQHNAVTALTLGSKSAIQISIGSALARNQIDVRFGGEGAATDVSGATLARGKQHCDTTLVVEHNVPACESREMFKLVLDDAARGIFQGKIVVAPDAQKTDGKQMSQALLLSETAEFDSKPELEIYADDVVCGHGATSGQIDEDLLFYLRARGLPEAQARALLIQAFVGEVFEALDDESLGEVFANVSAEWLGAAAE